MAVPVPSISCCVLNHHNLFYQIQNALVFNRDMCCHLALCLLLLPFHCVASPKVAKASGVPVIVAAIFTKKLANVNEPLSIQFELPSMSKTFPSSSLVSWQNKLERLYTTSFFYREVEYLLAMWDLPLWSLYKSPLYVWAPFFCKYTSPLRNFQLQTL